MGAPDGADAAIQMVAHGQLLRGGFGVEVHQNQLGVQLRQQLFHQQKGIVRAEGHVAAANEIHHSHRSGLGLKDAPAPARLLGRKVGGPQKIGTVFHHGDDVPTVPGVIAQGDDVGSGIQNLVGMGGRQTHHGGVFAVDHTEIHTILLLQLSQHGSEIFDAGGGYHIAHGQNVQFHRSLAFLIQFITVSIPCFRSKNNCPAHQSVPFFIL